MLHLSVSCVIYHNRQGNSIFIVLLVIVSFLATTPSKTWWSSMLGLLSWDYGGLCLLQLCPGVREWLGSSGAGKPMPCPDLTKSNNHLGWSISVWRRFLEKGHLGHLSLPVHYSFPFFFPSHRSGLSFCVRRGSIIALVFITWVNISILYLLHSWVYAAWWFQSAELTATNQKFAYTILNSFLGY